MNEKFVKNIVMNAKIGSKVVVDLSYSKLVDGTVCSPATKMEEFIDGNELWLLIGIPSRDPFFVTQYLE